MNKNQFISFIEQPNSLEDRDLKVLASLTESFPYCQIAHILQAKATHDANSMLANDMLKKAAVYSTDRVKLKRIIHSKNIKKELISTKTNSPIDNKVEIKAENNTDKLKKINEVEKFSSTEVKKNVINELEKTIKKSKEFKNNNKNIIDESIEIKEKNNEISKIAVEKKNLKTKIEKDLGDIWNSVYSSRLGESLESENIYNSEYPFDYQPYNFNITAPERINKSALIDEFIEKSPSISRLKSNSKVENQINLAEKSLKRKTAPKTETLAKLYLSQGNTKKALKIYEDLLLKVPEKRTYFASQIEKIKNKK